MEDREQRDAEPPEHDDRGEQVFLNLSQGKVSRMKVGRQ